MAFFKSGGRKIKGVVIAGTKSGCGKTTVTLGLMAALARRGLIVAPFKVGPDFIDPGHHTRVAGSVSKNLDGWMLPKAFNLANFDKVSKHTDIAVVEGVMGLFDGYDGKTDAGSTAQMARWLGIPVVLLVDAASMARSAAAMVMGFENFDPRLDFAGVVFNNLGSRRHLKYLEDAMQGSAKMPCLGGIMRRTDLAIPERHLGLVTHEDHPISDPMIAELADVVEDSLDLDFLLQLLPEIDPVSQPAAESNVRQKSVRIAVARDEAFCFYYQDNLELLEQSGAQIVSFSPVTDEWLPQQIDGLYLGGGYPELYAEKLSSNAGLRRQIREKSRDGMPVYGECGGFMYLCEELVDQSGYSYPMSGCFPFATQMHLRLKALGYREVTLSQSTVIGNQDLTIRGHEFHYSELLRVAPGVQTVYRISDRSGLDKAPEGYQVDHTLGSYNHLHFGSQPEAARCFVENCRDYRNRNRNGKL